MKNASLRVNKKKYREELKEAERKKEVQTMRYDAGVALKGMEQQRRYWFEKYQQKAAEGDFKQANWAFNMFKFMQKIYMLAQRYVEILDAQTAVGEVFNLLRTTNKSFGAIAKLSSGGLTRSVIRNLKKFKKSISRFTGNTDRIMKVFDSLFDEKKKRGKKAENAPSDEEIFRANLENNQDVVADYESQTGRRSATAPAAPTAAPSSPAPKGGSDMGGIGDPNDF